MSELIQKYLEDVRALSHLPTSKRNRAIILDEYPFDAQLLAMSPLYRKSRKAYLSLGGTFSQKLSSTMRSLSAQDLFKNEIEYSPSFTEMIWFKDHFIDVVDPEAEVQALIRFSDISLFHEQNHRVVWQLLPPPPTEQRDLLRYLNFAESLVVMFDAALGDELGKKLSPAFERMKVIYRDGGEDRWFANSKAEYRKYLLSFLTATYYSLELIHADDILGAINYVFPGQKKLNRDAVRRSFGLSELFVVVTNPQWQERHWKSARSKLKKIHANSEEDPLYLPKDPLDIEEVLYVAREALDFFGL
jgi:hypothetical protein